MRWKHWFCTECNILSSLKRMTECVHHGPHHHLRRRVKEAWRILTEKWPQVNKLMKLPVVAYVTQSEDGLIFLWSRLPSREKKPKPLRPVVLVLLLYDKYPARLCVSTQWCVCGTKFAGHTNWPFLLLMAQLPEGSQQRALNLCL